MLYIMMESCPLCYYRNTSQGTMDSTSDRGKVSKGAFEKGKIFSSTNDTDQAKIQVIITKVLLQTRLSACAGNIDRFISSCS